MRGFLDKKFQAFVHRGDTSNFRENTLEAFKDANNLGFNYLETDLRKKKDNKIVTFHDKDLERVCGRKIKLNEINFAELNK